MDTGALRWAEDESPGSGWHEDEPPALHYLVKCSSCGDIIAQCRCLGPHEVRYEVCDACSGRTAVRNAPSKPYFTDEYKPTDAELWERCLEVVNGKRRWYTQSGRTINSPNHGRGYRHMPNPKGIAWAIKQYNGFGGGWKARKDEQEGVEAHTAQLRILASGGVVAARPGELDALGRLGLARVASEAYGRVYWDVTAEGKRVALANLKQDLLEKMRGLEERASKQPSEGQLSRDDKLAMREVAEWFRKNFRVDTAKTPKGQKRLKEEAQRFVEVLEQWSSPNATINAQALPHILKEGPWARSLKPDLDNLVRFFTTEGASAAGRKEQVVEIRLGHATYFNRAILSEANFRKYAEKIDSVFGHVKGWRTKALKGNVTVCLSSRIGNEGSGQIRHGEGRDVG